MTKKRALNDRLDKLEAEVSRRRSASAVQAEDALRNDSRVPAVDARGDAELSTSEQQARALAAGQGKARGRRWEAIDS